MTDGACSTFTSLFRVFLPFKYMYIYMRPERLYILDQFFLYPLVVVEIIVIAPHRLVVITYCVCFLPLWLRLVLYVCVFIFMTMYILCTRILTYYNYFVFRIIYIHIYTNILVCINRR